MTQASLRWGMLLLVGAVMIVVTDEDPEHHSNPVKTSSAPFSIFTLSLLLLTLSMPVKAQVSELRELNESAKEIAAKIKQLNAARGNAHAAGEKKLACDFHAYITMKLAELMDIHKDKVKIFDSYNMHSSRERELAAISILDQIVQREFDEFQKRCR